MFVRALKDSVEGKLRGERGGESGCVYVCVWVKAICLHNTDCVMYAGEWLRMRVVFICCFVLYCCCCRLYPTFHVVACGDCCCFCCNMLHVLAYIGVCCGLIV